MKDSFERFVEEHRIEFDIHSPEEKIWAGIRKRIAPRAMKSHKWLRIVSRVAAVLLIFAASYAFHEFMDHRSEKKLLADDIYHLIPELKEAEVFYTNQVNARLSELKPYLSSYPNLREEIHADLGELDLAYQSLKSDLKDNIANEAVVEAMIQNYRIKLEILEDLLIELKNEKNDEHETESRQSI